LTDAGILQLHLFHDNKTVVGLKVKSTRPQVCQLLKGKTPESAVKLVPALFSLCGRAQGAAAQAAIAAACNISLTEKLSLERAVVCEAIQEHCWKLFLDWPKALGLAQLQGDFVRLHTILRRIAEGQGDINALKHEIESLWLGMSIVDWLDMKNFSDLQQWWKTSNSSAASLCAILDALEVNAIYEPTEKLSDVPLLPDWSALEAQASCVGKLNMNFAANPTWNMFPAETGALAYHVTATMLHNALKERPSRVLARVLAKVYDMLQMVNGNFTGRLDYGSSQEGTGFAIVKTARGILMHHVHIVAEVVQDYLVVAPTEWNFHSEGTLAAGLIGLKGDAGQLVRMAERQVLSLDPCVGYELKVSSHA
jgi:hypothetical protein